MDLRIGSCKEAQLAKLVRLVLGEMGVEISVVHYTAALSASEKAERWQLALELLDEMALAQNEKDVITYRAAISACEKAVAAIP